MDELMSAVKTCWRLTYALALCSLVWHVAALPAVGPITW